MLHAGWTDAQAADGSGVSRRTVAKWVPPATGCMWISRPWAASGKPGIARMAIGAAPRAGRGGEYGHGAVEDHRRLASVEVLDEQLGRTCAAFLPRAVAWLAARQGVVRRVLSDHGAGDRARAFRAACAAAAIRLLRTRPSTPRTNGTAERVIQTRLREWASVTPYRTSRDRRRALRPWLHFYNRQRPHASLNDAAPWSRLRNVA